jgi:fatty acid desaturase
MQPFYNVLLMAFFEWGVAFHDLDLDAVRSGEKSQKEVLKDLKGIWGKARDQVVKDYIAWPIISAAVATGVEYAWKSSAFDAVRPGRTGKVERAKTGARKLKGRVRRDSTVGSARPYLESGLKTYKAAAKANFTANIIRNFWSNAIIFCGHFPDQTYTFSQEETEDETRGRWYVRQLVGAANIDGSPMFHVLSGNLGYQVEHHLFPDMPSTRYGEIAPRVRDICERYELPYNSGGFGKQWGSVQRTILRLAFPGGKVRPKPGPYHGPRYRGSGEQAGEQAAGAA